MFEGNMNYWWSMQSINELSVVPFLTELENYPVHGSARHPVDIFQGLLIQLFGRIKELQRRIGGVVQTFPVPLSPEEENDSFS